MRIRLGRNRNGGNVFSLAVDQLASGIVGGISAVCAIDILDYAGLHSERVRSFAKARTAKLDDTGKING